MGCFAYCSLGVLSFHRRVPNISLTVGALWTALAFLGISAFFLALAIGGLLGIEEEEAGAAIIPPLLGVMFGVASMGPASLVLAVGVRRARLLPSTTRAAFWGLAFAFPALLIVGGLSEGTIETTMSGAVVGAFAVPLAANRQVDCSTVSAVSATENARCAECKALGRYADRPVAHCRISSRRSVQSKNPPSTTATSALRNRPASPSAIDLG